MFGMMVRSRFGSILSMKGQNLVYWYSPNFSWSRFGYCFIISLLILILLVQGKAEFSRFLQLLEFAGMADEVGGFVPTFS